MRSSKIRKRVAQACQRCRQRKFKCDGLKPECSTCKQASQTCLYESHMRRRGLPEGYVRGLELLASLAIRHIDKFEELLLSRLLQKGEEHHFEWHSDFEGLLDGWRNSKLAVELENLLPYLPSPKSQPVKRKFEDNQFAVEGPRRYWTDVSTPQPTYHIDESLLPEEEHPRGHADTSQVPDQLGGNTVSDNQLGPGRIMTTRSAQSTDTTSANIGLPLQVWSLMRIYFSQTHCWFPIVDKTEVMRSTYCYVNEKSETPRSSGALALVWAITTSTSSQLLKSGHLEEVLGTENASESLVSSFYTKCRELIPSEEGPFEIEHVQALLLLSLIKIDRSAWSTAWILIGKAVRIVTDLDCASPIAGTDPRSLRRFQETFLGCFVLDTLVAFYLLRPPHLREEDVDKIGEVDEDGLDEWDVWSNPLDTTRSSQNQYFPLFTLSSFNRLVNTCKVIQSVLLSRIHGTPFSQDRILENLHKESTRPPFDSIFKMQNTSNSSENKWLIHHYHLRLVYLLVVAELSPRSNSIVDRGDVSSQALEKSACFTEVRTLIKVLGDRFGLHSIPQTSSLVVDFLARSQMPTYPPLTTWNHSSSQGRVEPCHLFSEPPGQENIAQNQGMRSSLTEIEPTDGAVAQLDRELQQHDSLTDSNSIFNDFVAIDTSEWTSNWEEGLFNLGFTANSSANDFYEFIEPNT